MATHRGLKAWDLSRRLAVECIRAAKAFPLEERFGMADQLRRAATGAALNIVEGSSRTSYRDYRRFLDMARASLKEVEAILEMACEVGYLDTETFNRLEQLRDEASRTVYGLLRMVTRLAEAGKSR
jgi:four helix bundle protein